MPQWIALIRGINVGGKNMVPMKTLAADLDEAGARKASGLFCKAAMSCFSMQRKRPRRPKE
jgi:hypothetical protein